MNWITRIVVTLFCLSPSLAQEMVPFVIPLEMDASSPLAWQGNKPIAIDSPRIQVNEGHFVRDDQPVRIWGVNLSFAANFPTHADATKVAARLAHAGVNSVRLHHMDTANWPRGIWDADHPERLSTEALDRLDYFINQLACVGIYADLNLHVGRAHSQFIDTVPDTEHNYDKIYNLFTPALIEAQKNYARQLLGHVNPYRQVTYARDPAIAFVEISNENSFFMWDGDETLRSLKPYYARLLQRRYNGWLRQRYGTREVLSTTWAKDTQPLGDNLLRNSDLAADEQGTPASWHLEQHESCRAMVRMQKQGVRIQIQQRDDQGWHLQFNQRELTLQAGQYYTLTFTARSDKSRSLHCTVGQAHLPWQGLGLSRAIDLDSEWRTYRLGFVATDSDTNARVTFTFGSSDTAFELQSVLLCPGGQVGLGMHESWQDNGIDLFTDNESAARIADRWSFLVQTEKAFYDDMKHTIQQDLGCQAPVTGTIVFGPLGLYAQSDMDYVDAHAYWQHPHFPGRPWDPANWTLEQRPMVMHPQEATLFKLAAQRLAGKPFTVSEYNHPAPLDSQAACIPMVASFASAQDWDGIWLYTYSHSNDQWNRDRLSSYFDIDTNPAKWGFMRGGAELFRKRANPVLGHRAEIVLSDTENELEASMIDLHQRYGSDLFAALSSQYSTGRSQLMTVQLSARFWGKTSLWPVQGAFVYMDWGTEASQGLYRVASKRARVLVGAADLFDRRSGDLLSLEGNEHVSVVWVSLDGLPLDQSHGLLLTLCGRCENTGMVFSEDRRTVGRQWGTGPTTIEAFNGMITLPAGVWRAWALDGRGAKAREIEVADTEQGPQAQLSSKAKTMWYWFERAGDSHRPPD